MNWVIANRKQCGIMWWTSKTEVFSYWEYAFMVLCNRVAEMDFFFEIFKKFAQWWSRFSEKEPNEYTSRWVDIVFGLEILTIYSAVSSLKTLKRLIFKKKPISSCVKHMIGIFDPESHSKPVVLW